MRGLENCLPKENIAWKTRHAPNSCRRPQQHNRHSRYKVNSRTHDAYLLSGSCHFGRRVSHIVQSGDHDFHNWGRPARINRKTNSRLARSVKFSDVSSECRESTVFETHTISRALLDVDGPQRHGIVSVYHEQSALTGSGPASCSPAANAWICCFRIAVRYSPWSFPAPRFVRRYIAQKILDAAWTAFFSNSSPLASLPNDPINAESRRASYIKLSNTSGGAGP